MDCPSSPRSNFKPWRGNPDCLCRRRPQQHSIAMTLHRTTSQLAFRLPSRRRSELASRLTSRKWRERDIRSPRKAVRHPEPADEDLEVTEADDLCSRLSQIAPGQPSARMSSPCLGYLSGTDDYRYLIYKTSQLIPNTEGQISARAPPV